jgi:hypothetical protein
MVWIFSFQGFCCMKYAFGGDNVEDICFSIFYLIFFFFD